MMRKLLMYFTCTLLFLGGCRINQGIQNTENTNSPVTSLPSVFGYPAQGASGYPAPETQEDILSTTFPEDLYPPTPSIELSSESNTGVLLGVLFSVNSRITLPNTKVFLRSYNKNDPLAIIPGPDPSNGDIVGGTNIDSVFIIENIPPGSYILFVWSPYGWNYVIPSNQSIDPIILDILPGQSLNMGVALVPWP
jgi:hypothetical protein